MASRRALGGLFVLAAGLGAAIACSNYEPPDVANYGPPNGIDGKNPNGPPAGNGSSSGATPPPGGGDAGDGGTGTTGDGGGPTVTYACGTPIAQTTPCAVSWKTDIYPKMASGGAWNCAGASCHGAGNAPVLPGDAHGVYTTLANYTGTATSGAQAGLPYFNPCSADPAKSTLICNLQPAGSGGCGALQMPLGITVAAAGMTAVSTWVACGAPEN